MGQKVLASCLFFVPRLCQDFFLPVHSTILMIFFKKNLQLFFWLNDTWQKKLQTFVINNFDRVVKTSILTCPQYFLMGKNETFELFLSMSKTEPQTFGLLTEVFLRGSQYCFLLAHRKILVKESSYEKVIFYDISHFADFEREKLAFFSKTFGLVRQNFNLPELKLFVENNIFYEKPHFCFFLFFQRQLLKKIYLRFLKKLVGLSKMHSMRAKQGFSEKKKNFWKKLSFISFWDMGQKTLAFQHFVPRLCQNFNPLVHWTVLMNSFSKNLQLFFWLNCTWQKKLQTFVINFFGGVVTTSILRVHSNFWWKKNDNFLKFFVNVEDWATHFWTFYKTFPAL